MDIEQKIKDYLYFHLSPERKETLKNYLSNYDHFLIDKSKEESDKIMPITILAPVLVSPGSKIEQGKSINIDTQSVKDLKGLPILIW